MQRQRRPQVAGQEAVELDLWGQRGLEFGQKRREEGVLRRQGDPLDVDVRGPVAGDVRDDAAAALVKGRVVDGALADGVGVEVVEGWGEGREGVGGG